MRLTVFVFNTPLSNYKNVPNRTHIHWYSASHFVSFSSGETYGRGDEVASHWIKFSSSFIKALPYCELAVKERKYFFNSLILPYLSQVNIAEVSSGFHQADWSTTLGIVYCYPISFLFWFIFLLVSRNLILTISSQMQTSAQFKFALYVTND